jgi:pyruvate,water dikinase
MAVVVQRMVFRRAASMMFKGGPSSGNRKVISVEASFGLGEALVFGLVNADVYKGAGRRDRRHNVGTKKTRRRRLVGRRDAGTGDRTRAT